MNIKEALAELKKQKKRKFDQSIDLIINLKAIDLKKDQVNAIISIPNKVKEKKVCAFLKEKSDLIKTITEPEFKRYSDKKLLKNLVKDYDYFIAAAPLMPKVATTFGKVLGPVGKMPSPQLGILAQENAESIKTALEKISNSLKIRLKEASVKLIVGKESMPEEQVIENINAVYKAVESSLPKKKENVKNLLLKLTMTKPVKVEVK